MAAAALGLSGVQTRARAEGKIDPVSQAARMALAPGAMAGSWASQTFSTTWTGWTSGPRLASENQRLRELIGSYRIYSSEVGALRRELEDLKALVDAPASQGRDRVFARIISIHPFEHRMTLNVGSSQGVKAGLAVVGQEGLAGIVETASPTSCDVLLITSASSRVGASVSREASAYSLVRGVSQDSLSMEIAATFPVEVGDKVATAGFSELIPGGIPIGEVSQITDRPDFGTKQLTLFPAVRISAVRSLAVLK